MVVRMKMFDPQRQLEVDEHGFFAHPGHSRQGRKQRHVRAVPKARVRFGLGAFLIAFS